MREKLIELFKNDDVSITYKNIKRSLSINKKHLDDELKTLLKELQLEGILYEDDDSVFKSVPSNFFVTELKFTRKGLGYVEINDSRLYIDNSDLNGALSFDKVLISVNQDSTKVVKVIERTFPNLVCEVVMVDGVKKLKVLNSNAPIDIIAGSMTMKKLKENDVALFSIAETKFEGKYDINYVKTIGKNTDDNIMYDVIAYSNGFDPTYSNESYKEIEEMKKTIADEDIAERMDLRGLRTFTIDEEECRDMDDAISIRKNRKGYTLYVHIAHVSNYVKIGSSLFNEALKKCTSLYYHNNVIPMLPEILSKDLCSLNENSDKLARTVIIKFDNDGNLLNYNIVKSVIRSNKKMDYTSAERVLSGEKLEGYEEYEKDLKILSELDNKMVSKNHFNLYNIEKDATDIAPKFSTHSMIRDFMVMANHLVALYMLDKPCIYRNHPVPSEKKIRETLSAIGEFSNNVSNLSVVDSNILLERLFKTAQNKDDLLVISSAIFSSLKTAYYSEYNEGHFSLGFADGYVHFTSPIRRISDLVIGNLLDMYEEKELSEEEVTKLKEFLKQVALIASRKERMAERCQCELEDISFLTKIKESIGQSLECYIEEIHEDYIVVGNKGMMDGIIRFDDMLINDFRLLPSGKLKSRETGRVYKVGHKLEVEILDISFADRSVFYRELSNLTIKEVEEEKRRKKLLMAI